MSGLTSDQVSSIRLSNLSDEHWAALFGVNRSSVKRARVGATHIDNPVPPQSAGRRPRFDTGAKRNGKPAAADLVSLSLPGEEWRPVVGWERFYCVSNLGRVYSLHQTGRFVTGMHTRDGYNVLKLRDGERRANGVVHRLVLESFVGPAPDDQHEGCHNDGDPENCRLDNLRWDTPKGNQADRIIHGTMATTGAARKLSVERVREMRTSPEVTLAEWAQRFGCSVGTVVNARRGRTWKNVDVSPLRKRA